ncbi:MAG: Pimelyl-[acyl-carrier protein] methyl ester esterase [Marmoricola sp.]|nr:Pimelyl-[acyl-carrier protein] methyl ester esterase [Marmoricola sp.]
MSATAVISGAADGPPIVLIHGVGGSHRVWDRVVPGLAQEAQTLAVDLNPTNSIERDADAIAGLLKAPGLIVGHSRGGLVATALAERHHDLVRGLVLICTPWSTQSRLAARGSVEQLLGAPVVGSALWALAGGRRTQNALKSAFAPGIQVPPEFVTDVRRRGRRIFVDSSHAIDRYLAEASLVERIDELQVPTVLVEGGFDARVAHLPPVSGRPATAEVIRLPAAGHTPPWEDPVATKRIILDALDLERGRALGTQNTTGEAS